MDNCTHCLSFHHNWTKYDALTHTWLKQYQENGLFLDTIQLLPCIHCKPKQRITNDVWKGLDEYYKQRGIK